MDIEKLRNAAEELDKVYCNLMSLISCLELLQRVSPSGNDSVEVIAQGYVDTLELFESYLTDQAETVETIRYRINNMLRSDTE